MRAWPIVRARAAARRLHALLGAGGRAARARRGRAARGAPCRLMRALAAEWQRRSRRGLRAVGAARIAAYVVAAAADHERLAEEGGGRAEKRRAMRALAARLDEATTALMARPARAARPAGTLPGGRPGAPRGGLPHAGRGGVVGHARRSSARRWVVRPAAWSPTS